MQNVHVYMHRLYMHNAIMYVFIHVNTCMYIQIYLDTHVFVYVNMQYTTVHVYCMHETMYVQVYTCVCTCSTHVHYTCIYI